jgi:hypothetical protein
MQRCLAQIRHQQAVPSFRPQHNLTIKRHHVTTAAAADAGDAPSVLMPEIAIPSAGTNVPLSRVFTSKSVLWPESFRGGCSFGTNKVGSPDFDYDAICPVPD